MEYLSGVTPRLPQGVRTELGPDASGVGWVFQYALVDTTGQRGLDELRSYQDWYLRSYLKSVPGVAEVAPLGGFVRQYQVQVDPNRLRAFNIPVGRVVEAVRSGNSDVGGRLVELSGAEYMVRGRGYAKSTADLGNIVLARTETGSSIRVRDVGTVTLGPDIRRGVTDLDGTGEAVTGIVVMRQGENALTVIERVKAKLKDLEPSLPRGVKVVTTYDRSELILRSIDNLKQTLIEELIIVALVILVFLWHVPSAIIPIVTIPVAITISFIPMRLFGISSNIMSLGGLAIAVGAMVDAAIVVVEQTHKKLEQWDRTGRYGGLSPRRHRRGQRGRRPELLCPARHRRLIPPGAHARSAGRTTVPSSRLHQELFDDGGCRPRDHAGPGDAAAVHARAAVFLPSGVAGTRGERTAGRSNPCGGNAPDQPRPHSRVRAGVPMVAALEVGGHRGRRGHRRGDDPDLPAPWIRVHAPARRRHAALHALDPAWDFGRPRRSVSCRSRTGSSRASPRSSACSARPGAPRPRPTRRRSR